MTAKLFACYTLLMTNELEKPLEWHNETRKVSELVPYERNPRKITEDQMEYLKISLKKYNLVDVPTIDTDGTLISGHQRTRALHLIGRGDDVIDVRVPNRKLTEEEFKYLNIEANKLRGIYDFEILAADFDVEELLSLGFSERELDMIDFPEIEGVSIGDETEDFENKKYELLFDTDEDYKEFLSIIRRIQEGYVDKSLSNALLTYLRDNAKTT